MKPIDGRTHLGNLYRLSDALSRSISAENPTGAPHAGGLATEGFGAQAAEELGPGWKISPAVTIGAGADQEIALIDGPGCLQQIWMTATGDLRSLILRIYWDGQERPSVESPLGDFFASGWGVFSPISSLAICVNPTNGLNCYWQMPFQRQCRITVQNRSASDASLFYQINYQLADVPDNAAYFHAQFRRTNPVPYKEVHTVVDRIVGRGHFVGTYMAWGANEPGWWGEGEFKFFLDGEESPTICGTGTEDYFGGAWCFLADDTYATFTTPYSGMPIAYRANPEDGGTMPNRFSLYRWHITDPIRFSTGLRVTVQALGLRDDRYVALEDDIASVAYWYQALPTAPFPELPEHDELAT